LPSRRFGMFKTLMNASSSLGFSANLFGDRLGKGGVGAGSEAGILACERNSGFAQPALSDVQNPHKRLVIARVQPSP
jgi:hypothetical protein